MKLLTLMRIACGWSQSELARRSGLHASTISLAESGRFRLSPVQLAKLAVALNTSEAQGLLDDVEPITAQRLQ